VELSLTLALPRDTMSVPVVRRLLSSAMTTLGVTADCVDDIAVVVSEACTNVLDHAREGDEYEVRASLDERTCEIDIIDRGGGFDLAALGHGPASEDDESGRGVQLMRVLVDRLHFVGTGESGTTVRFEKALSLREDAALRELAGRSPEPDASR
jgi:serine/threonine-protein kinase RsbW